MTAPFLICRRAFPASERFMALHGAERLPAPAGLYTTYLNREEDVMSRHPTIKFVLLSTVFLFILCSVLMLACSACSNRQFFDTTYTFTRAYVVMPDGSCVSGKVDAWHDYEDSDMVQVVIKGKTYYTHGSNVVLVNDGK
jgi:hypothetical protein